MIKFSKKIEYSLLILYFLHENATSLVSASQISRHYGIAFDSISKLMQKLAKHDFLLSEQGSLGGYSLKADLKDISMLNLIDVISGPLKLVRCLDGDCDKEILCNIKQPLELLNERLSSFYSKISIAELFEREYGEK